MASESSKEENKDVGGKKESKVTKASLNMNELRELADLVDEHGFTDFEFENEKIRVRLSKNLVAPTQQIVQAQPVSAPVQQAESSTASAGGETVSSEVGSVGSDADDGLYKITSPIVGTFYSSAAPDKPAFVKKGDMVSNDTVVCIIEAMKLMNEIQAETAGEIVKIYVENAQPVEYGQPLFGIKK